MTNDTPPRHLLRLDYYEDGQLMVDTFSTGFCETPESLAAVLRELAKSLDENPRSTLVVPRPD